MAFGESGFDLIREYAIPAIGLGYTLLGLIGIYLCQLVWRKQLFQEKSTQLEFRGPSIFPYCFDRENISRRTYTPEDKISANSYNEITALDNFEWQTQEPLKFRPFKPRYHLTMGITNTTFSELIEMDKTYLDRITLRKQIMLDHPDITIQVDRSITPAVNELYTYVVGTYLPRRYPTMFKLVDFNSTTTQPSCLYNKVTRTTIPITPPSDPREALRNLGENLDEEFLLLTKADGDDQYALKGYVTCFPSGFNTKDKFGLKLRDIHGPVPGYKEKLELSMDRFFDRMEVGKIVKRVNWSVTTHDRLYLPSGNHLYNGEEVVEEEVDVLKTHIRCERQLLWRLPQTKAMVFSFKTYLYPISDIKKEGLGEELALAIDGLKEGSTPAMHFYKKGVVWGEIVKTYLRN